MKLTKKIIEQSQVSAPKWKKRNTVAIPLWKTSLEKFQFFFLFFKIHLLHLQRKPNERMKIDGMTNENLSLQCKNGMCSDL